MSSNHPGLSLVPPSRPRRKRTCRAAARGEQPSTSSQLICMMIDTEPRRQRMGEERKLVRYLGGRPHTLPEFWTRLLRLMATTAQKALCHETTSKPLAESELAIEGSAERVWEYVSA